MILEACEGRTAFVRELDPGEEAVPIMLDPGEYEIVLMTPIHSAMVCQTEEVGADDSLTGPQRVVLEERDGETVYVRTLRRGEPDDGRRVHLRPGEKLVFQSGAFQVDLDDLDEQFSSDVDGYAPLTNTIWTWVSIRYEGGEHVGVLYVLAAARRLDAAAASWSRVLAELPTVEELTKTSSNPTTRAMIFQLVADMELAIIALGRVTDMIARAATAIGADVPVPEIILKRSKTLKEIRDAFEHIDERAMGQVHRQPSASATSIFRQHRLLEDRIIAYGRHEVSFDEVTQVLAESRRFLKDVAATLRAVSSA